jgi:glycosyltransferase involved in cell wall biosynthesis
MCRKDFLLSFDHICQFDDFIPSAKLLQSIIGDDEYSKRFVPLHLMYDMNGDPKKWGKPEDRIKAVEYLGRFVSIKDPQRLIRAKEWLDKSGYVIEMRGLIRMISLIGIPDLCYKFVDGQKTDEPSEKVTWVKKGWMKEQGFEDQGDVLYYPLEKRDGRIFIFGNYDNKTIYNYIKNAAYVCDFFNLKKDDYCPPQHLEYVMFEFINNGIITILDSQIGRTAYLYKDGKKTDRRFDQVSIALYLNKDLSNIEEVIEKMNFLYDNPNEYEKFRLSAFNLIKEHASPKNIVRTLCENMKLS